MKGKLNKLSKSEWDFFLKIIKVCRNNIIFYGDEFPYWRGKF